MTSPIQGRKQDFDGTHGFTANQGGEAVGDTITDIEDVVGSDLTTIG